MKTFQKLSALLLTGAMVLTFVKAADAADSRPVTVTLRAADNISGVTMMQIAEDRNNPPAAVTFESVTVVNTAANSLWVRIQDRAGNWSPWAEIVVGGDPYQDVANFNTLPTPSPSPSTPTSGGGFGGGGGGGGGGFGGAGGFAPPPIEVETTTVKLEEKIETKTVTVSPTPTPTVTPEAKPTPSPSSSPTPTIPPSPSVTATTAGLKRPDLVRPSAPAVSKSLGNGLTQVSQKIANSAPIIFSSPPAVSAAKAPTINTAVGNAVKPLVSALPSKSQLAVSVIINGKSVTLGKVTTNSKGEVILPAISSAKKGVITILMRTTTGRSYFTKINFKGKNK